MLLKLIQVMTRAQDDDDNDDGDDDVAALAVVAGLFVDLFFGLLGSTYFLWSFDVRQQQHQQQQEQQQQQ